MSLFKRKSKQKSVQETKSTARIINSKIVEVTAPDGEIFHIISQIGIYTDVQYQNYQLKILELIFDKYFSEDKEEMFNNIWRNVMQNGISFKGMTPGNRQQERVRIGARIREIREERRIEAKDLAQLAGIDAANLSRIENGKYSVGLDILSKIAASLGKKVDLVDITTNK